MSDTGLRRAGFWRRVAAAVVDFLVVIVPLQLLLATAFAATGGGIQGDFGLTWTSCSAPSDDVRSLLMGGVLRISDPRVSPVACTTRFAGLPTRVQLALVRGGREEASGSQDESPRLAMIAVDADLLPSRPLTVSWLPLPIYAIVIASLWAMTGKTLGARLFRFRVVALAAPARPGIGDRAAWKRILYWFTVNGILTGPLYVLMTLGAIGLGAIFVGPDGTVRAEVFWGIVALVPLQFGVGLWMLVDIVRRRDPIYDRLAGTAVILD